MSTDKHPPAAVESAPDPDEDDLDDLDELDDVLDEFAATKIDAKAKAPSSSGPGRPLNATTAADDPGDFDEDEFAKQLQGEMAKLFGGLGEDPKMAKEFEAMMKELGEAAAKEAEGTASGSSSSAAAGPTASASTSKTEKASEDAFQANIRKTMERMQESGQQAGAAAAASSEDDMLAQLLKEMEKGMGGEGGEEDFSKMLMGMMEQLTNKEILYEPMKELHEKFPGWLEKNKDSVPKADLERYKEQQKLCTEITAKFEERGYSDDNAACREYIVERMQKMQEAGSPPPDLVGDMNAAKEALGEVDSGCPQQ